MHFKQQLISSFLFGFVLADMSQPVNTWTEEEKYNASVVIWVCIVVGVLISISAVAGGVFFYMMRKRNNMNNGAIVAGGGGGGVVVVG